MKIYEIRDETDDEVKVCPARNKCLRYLERETFRGLVYQYPIMSAPTINKLGCDSLIEPSNYQFLKY